MSALRETTNLTRHSLILSDRPAAIKADIAIDLPFPRHRGDQRLAELRREILGLLGLDANWYRRSFR